MESTNPSEVMSTSDKSVPVMLPKHVRQAMEDIVSSTIAWWQFRERAGKQTYGQQKDPRWSYKPYKEEEAEIKSWIEVLDLADATGALDPKVLFLQRAMAIEQLHSIRSIAGLYKELEDISSQMRVIEEREGLEDLEYWPIGEGPEDWNQLNNQYEKILDVKFEETLREVGLERMADLYHADRKTYEARREEGRVIMFSKTPDLAKLSSVQKQLESEADACAKAGAYLAASVMIGAAIEAALLFACLNDPGATRAARAKLGKKKTKRQGKDPKRWTLKHLVDIAFAAGWLPDSKIDDIVLESEFLAAMIREFRNSVHPGRHLSPGGARDFERAFKDSKAAYVLLKWGLARSKTSSNGT